MSCSISCIALTVLVTYLLYGYMDTQFAISNWIKVGDMKRDALTYMCREKFSETWEHVTSNDLDSLSIVRTIDSSAFCDEVLAFTNIRNAMQLEIGKNDMQRLRNGVPNASTVSKCDEAVQKRKRQIRCVLDSLFAKNRGLRSNWSMKMKDCDRVELDRFPIVEEDPVQF